MIMGKIFPMHLESVVLSLDTINIGNLYQNKGVFDCEIFFLMSKCRME